MLGPINVTLKNNALFIYFSVLVAFGAAVAAAAAPSQCVSYNSGVPCAAASPVLADVDFLQEYARKQLTIRPLEAISCFQRVVTFAPDNCIVFSNLAVVYRQTNLPELEFSCLEHAMSLKSVKQDIETVLAYAGALVRGDGIPAADQYSRKLLQGVTRLQRLNPIFGYVARASATVGK